MAVSINISGETFAEILDELAELPRLTQNTLPREKQAVMAAEAVAMQEAVENEAPESPVTHDLPPGGSQPPTKSERSDRDSLLASARSLAVRMAKDQLEAFKQIMADSECSSISTATDGELVLLISQLEAAIGA